MALLVDAYETNPRQTRYAPLSLSLSLSPSPSLSLSLFLYFPFSDRPGNALKLN
jgi:hypothetical protein